jgi:hypothetical protein
VKILRTKMLKISASVFSFLFVFISVHGQESNWERVKNSSGIEIYTRPVSGSSIKEFRAVTVVQGSISSVLAMLDDTASYPRWMYRCTEAQLLSKKDVYERVTYTVTSSPWPVDPRDIAVKSVISQNKKTFVVTVSLSGLPGYIPAKSGKVRMARVNGCWMLEPLGNGRVRVTYRLHSEPGGSVPDSIVNSSLVDIPYNTLYNMQRFVLQPPYKDARYKEIMEK